MTVHICRDLVVGSTGSYSNMYALGCFLQGVLGFTQQSAGGRSEWINSLLPHSQFSGSTITRPSAKIYASGSYGILELAIADLDLVADDEVGFVRGLKFEGGGKPEYLNVLSASTYFTSYPHTPNTVFGYPGSSIPAGTPHVTQSNGTYYVSKDGITSGAITMNLPIECIDVDPLPYFMDSLMLVPDPSHTFFYTPDDPWLPDYDSPTPDIFTPQPFLRDWILAIKSNTYPLINSGLYRIVKAGGSPTIGRVTTDGYVTGTFKIAFDPRVSISGSAPLTDTDFSFTLFYPVESIYNDLDPVFNYDPDNDGDVDISGYDNNPPQTQHSGFPGSTSRGTPPCDSLPLDTNPVTYSFNDDTDLPPFDLDDFYGPPYNKAYLFNIWNPFGETGYPDSLLGRTLVAELVDQTHINLWNAPTNVDRYHTSGNSYMLRVIYQSPHPSGWQVRLAMESWYDRNGGCAGVSLSIAPGFSGSNGDFQVRGPHLHGPQWYNSTSSVYRGSVVGLNPTLAGFNGIVSSDVGNQIANSHQYRYTSFDAGANRSDYRWRFFAWGDDVTGTVVVCNRNLINASDEFVMFGIPEDEPQPVPVEPLSRLFVVGQSQHSQGIDWRCGTRNDEGISGVAYSLQKHLGPVSCIMAPYVYTSQNQNINSIRFDGSASDTPFLGGSELMPVDLIAGTLDSPNFRTDARVLPFEPRRMGRVPFARLGRANTSNWTTTDASNLWFHTTNGFYLPWSGLTPLP